MRPGPRRRVLAALLAALCAPACDGRPTAGAVPPRFAVAEVLTNPTATSADLVLVPEEDVEIYAEYGPAPGGRGHRTPAEHIGAGRRAHLRLLGLLPDAAYAYRVHVRRPAERGFHGREPGRFRTLRERRDTPFRFAYAADSHIVGRFVRAACGADPAFEGGLENFARSLAHLRAADPDFVVAGGDNFMTAAPHFSSCEGYTALGEGSARSPAEAEARYRLALSPALWGAVTARIPFLYVLGNHDGEVRFGDPQGSYGHFSETLAHSRAARLGLLPDPTRVYDGSGGGALYYSFASGPARFVVLDVMAGPERLPKSAVDWTLGAEQWRWLERVLAENDRPWVFVFLEHLVGGVTSPAGRPRAFEGSGPGEYHYGRGGLRATADRTPRSPFLGEQERLHQRLREAGVDVVFHAHDHVAQLGEKQRADGSGDGVLYALGGQVSGRAGGPAWQGLAWFRDEMDYDLDGEADFLSGRNASASPGFYLVSVEGEARAELRYVQSDADDAGRDGTPAFTRALRR